MHVSKPPSLTPSILFVPVTNTFQSKLLPLLRSCRCEKREARSLLREPAGHHGSCSNTPAVGAGLTAKFVAFLHRFPLQYFFTPPTGSRGRSGGEEVRTQSREGGGGEENEKRGKRAAH